MVDRHGPLRAPLGQWVESVNGGRISDGAVLVTGVEMGFEDIFVEQLDGAPGVAGGSVSTVVPAGARAIKIAYVPDPSNVLALVPGPALADGELVAAAEGNRLDAASFFPPGARTIKIESVDPEAADVGAWLSPENPDAAAFDVAETSVVLFGGERDPAELFGASADGPEWEPVEAGESFDPDTTVFALPGDVLFGDDGAPWDAVFDAGRPAPLSGATFAMAVLSTPNATVAGQSVSPLVRLGTGDLLRNEAARGLLTQAGITDVDGIEWLAGPEALDIEDGAEVAVFGSEPDNGIETFAGVVNGVDGPWRVVVHVVRATGEDHVIVAGVDRQAVGTAETPVFGSALADAESVRQGRELMYDAVAQLE